MKTSTLENDKASAVAILAARLTRPRYLKMLQDDSERLAMIVAQTVVQLNHGHVIGAEAMNMATLGFRKLSGGCSIRRRDAIRRYADGIVTAAAAKATKHA